MNREDLIVKYFNQSLSEEEQQLFDSLKNNDADFNALLEEHKDMRFAYKLLEKDSLKAHLKSIEHENSRDKSPFYKNKKLWLAIASCVLIGLFYFLPIESSNSIYEDYFEEYPNVYAPVVRGDSNSQSEAFRAYESGNYSEASKQFKSILSEKSNPNISFYYAMSLLNLGELEEAQAILTNLKTETFNFSPEVYWYSGLIDMKLENYTDAKTSLEFLKSSNSTFKKGQTDDLLKYIDNKLN